MGGGFQLGIDMTNLKDRSESASGDRLIDRADALFLDLDGTVYHGMRPIPEAVATLKQVYPYVGFKYITNNASRSSDTVANVLREMGLPASPGDILTSAEAGISLLTKKVPEGSAILVLGSSALKELAVKAGFVVVESADDFPVAVIQGHAPTTGWAQMSEAALAINNGAMYIATNMDTTLPTERGLTVGNGSMIAAVTSATSVIPLSAGKPSGDMFTQAASELNSVRPLAVGDRLNTDIAGGVAAGMSTLMVMTGVSGHHDLLVAEPSERPTYIAEDMTALFRPAVQSTPEPKPGWRIHLTPEGVLTLSSIDNSHTPSNKGRSHDALLGALAVVWRKGAPPVTTVTATDEHAQNVIDTWR